MNAPAITGLDSNNINKETENHKSPSASSLSKAQQEDVRLFVQQLFNERDSVCNKTEENKPVVLNPKN